MINAGTVGAGGTGNLTEHAGHRHRPHDLLARRASPRWRPTWSRSTPPTATRGPSASPRHRRARGVSRLTVRGASFSIASHFKSSGVQPIYACNWSGIESAAGLRRSCLFDSGLINPDCTPRPISNASRASSSTYSR